MLAVLNCSFEPSNTVQALHFSGMTLWLSRNETNDRQIVCSAAREVGHKNHTTEAFFLCIGKGVAGNK
jgi:hypothetical protein